MKKKSLKTGAANQVIDNVATVDFRRNERVIKYDKLEREPIRIGDKIYMVELGLVDVKDIKLDKYNPRVQYEYGSDIDEAELIKYLSEKQYVKNLRTAIRSNNGILHAILITYDGRVLEGNLRTVCYKTLSKMHPDDPRWKKIKARILPEDIGRHDIDILLGEYHVSGVIKWSNFEQAGHLKKLSNHDSLDNLSKLYRKSKSTIFNQISAYDLMDKFLSRTKEEDKKWNVRPEATWSYFYEFFKSLTKIKKEKRDEPKDKFIEWMLSEKFEEGKEVRWLPKIIETDAAYSFFNSKNGTARGAWQIVRQENPELDSDFYKKIKETTALLSQANLVELSTKDVKKVQIMKSLKAAIDTFLEIHQSVVKK